MHPARPRTMMETESLVQKVNRVLVENNMVLKVPYHKREDAILVQRKIREGWEPVLDPIPFVDFVPIDMLDEVIMHLYHLHCHNVFERMGWKELGLDGTKADYYVPMSHYNVRAAKGGV